MAYGTTTTNVAAQRRARRPAVPGVSIATLGAMALLVAAGCGGNEGRDAGATRAQTSLPKVVKAAGFPRPSGRSLRALIGEMPQGPQLAPSVSVLEPGTNRFAFALFDRSNKQIGDLRVGLYTAMGLDEPARGPYLASFKPIEVESRFRSRTSSTDPDAARSVYVTRLHFSSPGPFAVSAVARLNKKLVATPPAGVAVSSGSPVPGAGDRAIRVHTPTVRSIGGDIGKIETRDPPDKMHDVDLADALDRHEPVLLLFSTPALCQSRVCGPVTDIAEQVRSEFGRQAAFIHMEIYNGNDPNKGVRPQMRAWHLKTEPFAFAIDSRGFVAARLEGAFSVQELRTAVRKALR